MDIDEVGVITDSYVLMMLPYDVIDYMKRSPHWEHVPLAGVWINRLIIPDGRDIYKH